MSRPTLLVFLGWGVAGAFLAAGLPLFLRMPLWCDVTLYDVAARNVLTGGVHYRDVFDTNPPGFVWLMCLVRIALGPSPEVVRVVDLGIVFLVVAFLLMWARRAGASHAGIAWVAAAVAAFYPLVHEFNHAQRDVWMMLPAAAAIGLRLRQMTARSLAVAVREEPQRAPTARERGSQVLEGFLWGLGCWIKPQLLFVAAAVWLTTTGRLGARRVVLRDFLTVFVGGLLALFAGSAWLVGTGAWPHSLDTWRNWNATYAAVVLKELPFRLTIQLGYFPPYSVCVFLAAPLAAWNLRDRTSDDPTRFRRAVLAAVYLAWLASALLFQRGFHYVHVPETLLMLAVFAANRWPVPAVLVLVQVIGGMIGLAADQNPTLANAHRVLRQSSSVYRQLTVRNPAFDANRVKWWSGCFASQPPSELRRGVALWTAHFGSIDPVELGAVADFLRTQNVRDGELIAWHDTPHALYLELNIRPGFRFQHVGTAAGLGPWQAEQILRELRAATPNARFAVSDLYRVTARHEELTDAGDDGLPRVLPAWQRGEFPFDQPVVFRSPGGRYLVHRLVHPVRSCVIPESLDQQSPSEPRP